MVDSTLTRFWAPPRALFTEDDAHAAGEAWTFNCGPGALCAVLGLRPSELRPHLGDFEQKGYTNPTLMLETLKRLGVEHHVTQRNTIGPTGTPSKAWPVFGLARVQWGGPWTRPGVPMRARYRQTHWVASHQHGGRHSVFDINAIGQGGWVKFDGWRDILVPWILEQGYPRADGTWWLTHCIEIDPREPERFTLTRQAQAAREVHP